MSRRSNGDGSVFKKRPDLWGAYFTLPDGTRKYFYAKTKRDVLEKLRLFRIKVDRGHVITNDNRTVGEYLTWWIADQKRYLAPETWRGYESKVRLHLIPGFEDVKLLRLSAIQIREFLALKLDEGQSTRSVNNIYDVLHAALEDARQMEITDRNVASLVEAPKIIINKRTALTADEAFKLLATLEGDPLEPFFRTLLTLGLRPGEGLGLQWSSINFEEKTIRIETTLQRQEGKWVIKPTPKTDASEQTLPLPNFLADVLQKRRIDQAKDKLNAGPMWEEWGLVFTRAAGNPIWFSDVNRHLEKMCKKAKVPKVTMHELRHSTPSILLKLGVDQRVIMRILRHSTIVLTANLYTHVVDPIVREALDKIDGRLNSAQNKSREGAHEGALDTSEEEDGESDQGKKAS